MFWSRIACSWAGVNASAEQGSISPPGLTQLEFSYWHRIMFVSACARAAAIVGLMSDSFCVNPDQPAENDSAGPKLDAAARTPHAAACSRARSALGAGFVCSPIGKRPSGRHGGAGQGEESRTHAAAQSD